MRYQFTHEIPSPPTTLRDRAERLLALSITLDAMDPIPPKDQPPLPRAPASDGHAQRFYKLADANRELYDAEFGLFLQEAKQFRDDIEAWALEVGNAAKDKGGEIQRPVPAAPAIPGQPLFAPDVVHSDD